ncbi:MAG: transcriptional regulator GcvA [Oceanospirillaceae bacterium]
MIRRMPPLNALKAFEAAARHLSFTKAAQELNVTQAAISHQVRTLEEYLSASLFNRSSQRLSLTESGRTLLPNITQAFNLVEKGYQNLHRQTAHPKLTIKAPSSFSVQWLMPRLVAYQKLVPDIEISLSAQDNDLEFFQEIFDIEIRYLFDRDKEAGKTLLFKEEIFPVCSPVLLTQAKPLLVAADIVQHALLHINFYPEDWQMWLEHAGVEGVEYERGHRFDQSVLTLEAAVQGLGIAMGRTPIVDQKLKSGELVAPFSEKLPSSGGYWLMIKADVDTPAHVAHFRQWIIDLARIENQRVIN